MDTASTNKPLPLDSPAARAALADVSHVYTDLDGTLLAPGGRLLARHDGKPSSAAAQALVELRQLGVEITMVTGRNRSQGTEIMRLLNFERFIGEMGCVEQIGYGDAARIIYHLGNWPNNWSERSDTQVNLSYDDKKSRLDNQPRRFVALAKNHHLTPLQIIIRSGAIELLERKFAGRLEKHDPTGDRREVTQMMRGFVDDRAAARVLSAIQPPLQLFNNGIIHPPFHNLRDTNPIHIYHLMPQGAGKDSAVAADIQWRGLRREQTLAIGDAASDLAMGRYTGVFVLARTSQNAHLQEQRVWERGEICDGFFTTGYTIDGWVEFAQALIAAKRS
ncbi:MAG: HAD hydrolase family protein [Coriobacteriales bacterium]|jgi:phosphoserine phosphatase|nr:HAD hydrolase family protein [Coriobacteriales bacterium]